MRKSAGCNECTHPTCRYSLGHNGICACYICKQGIFVLDVTSMPKYRLACNKFVEMIFNLKSISFFYCFVV
jgi:DNA topoisomerase-3